MQRRRVPQSIRPLQRCPQSKRIHDKPALRTTRRKKQLQQEKETNTEDNLVQPAIQPKCRDERSENLSPACEQALYSQPRPAQDLQSQHPQNKL